MLRSSYVAPKSITGKTIGPRHCLPAVATMLPEEFYKRRVFFPAVALTNKNLKMLHMINETINQYLQIAALTARFAGVSPKARTQDGTVKDPIFTLSETEKADAN